MEPLQHSQAQGGGGSSPELGKKQMQAGGPRAESQRLQGACGSLARVFPVLPLSAVNSG